VEDHGAGRLSGKRTPLSLDTVRSWSLVLTALKFACTHLRFALSTKLRAAPPEEYISLKERNDSVGGISELVVSEGKRGMRIS